MMRLLPLCLLGRAMELVRGLLRLPFLVVCSHVMLMSFASCRTSYEHTSQIRAANAAHAYNTSIPTFAFLQPQLFVVS